MSNLKGVLMSRRLALVLVAITALALPGMASAATTHTDYAPDNPAGNTSPRTFVTSAGGWTNAKTADALCVLVITCPAVTNGFTATGGVGGAGDGFIRTNFAGLVGVSTDLTSVRGIWTSPTFTYNGNGASTVDEVRFLMSRRSNAST